MILLHIPKTGGTAVYSIFEVETVWHSRIQDLDPKKKYFSIVRNPYDRFTSAFYHHYNIHDDRSMFKGIDREGNKIYKFKGVNDFLSKINNKDKVAVNMFNKYIHFKPMTYFLLDKDNKLPKNLTIFKYESFFKNNQVPRINECISKKEALSEESKKIIRSIYRADFKFFYPNLI